MNWIKTEIIYPKRLVFKAENLYEKIIKNVENEKGAKNSIENIKENI